jgi:ribosomal protein L11 methyltransferase
LARWDVFEVTLPRPAVGPVSAGLRGLGAVGLQEDVPEGTTLTFRQPWDKGPPPRAPKKVRLRAWFDARPSDDAVSAVLAGWSHADPTWAEQREQDWQEEWKQHFQPIRVSARLTIAAPWHGIAGAVVIEPGNAFGTGEHATTRACLEAVDRFAIKHGRCLDVGCGSGILALAAAHLGMRAHGTDIDPDAVRAAQEAATANHLAVTFDTAPIEAVPDGWDLVVANLFAEVLAALAVDLRRVSRTCPLALAGILADRADLVRDAFAGRPVLRDTSADGWTVLWYGPEVVGTEPA